MLTHDEMVGLQKEKHELVSQTAFESREQYVLHLIHGAAYEKAARMSTGLRVLDLGCNTGYGTARIAQFASRAEGVDVSAKAIEVAARLQRPGLRFSIVDGTSLPFADGSFDLVTSFQVIEHIVDHRPYFSEIKRVLVRSGGTVLFSTPNARLRLDPGMRPWNPFHVREYDHAELRDCLAEHFASVEILGLVADEPLAGIERARLDRSRARARAAAAAPPSRPARGEWARRFLPVGLEARLRAAVRGDPPPNPPSWNDPAFTSRYGVDDFRYSPEHLEEALDLLAICSDCAR